MALPRNLLSPITPNIINNSAVGSEFSVASPALLPVEILALSAVVVSAVFPLLVALVAPQPFGSRSQFVGFSFIDQLSRACVPLIITW